MELNLGAAAFWIALAAVIIASGWFRSRSEAQKHETLRTIIEKTGQVDEEQLRALVLPRVPHLPNHHLWGREPTPGGGYRALRVLGSLVLFVAAGLCLFFVIVGLTTERSWEAALPGLATTAIIAVVGVGLFFSSRFLEKPDDHSQDDGRIS